MNEDQIERDYQAKCRRIDAWAARQNPILFHINLERVLKKIICLYDEDVPMTRYQASLLKEIREELMELVAL